MNRFGAAAVAFASGALLFGCSSTPVDTSAQAGPVATAASAASAPAASSGSVGSSTVATVTLAPHLDPTSAISKERSVYFDYDVFTVKAEYVGLLERHAKYLIAHPTLKVRIEGNADDRGGAEYNLALGQKRAEAVVKAMQIYGANAAQMEAISWGKERPVALGHDEAAWAQNRRVDIVYPRQ